MVVVTGGRWWVGVGEVGSVTRRRRKENEGLGIRLRVVAWQRQRLPDLSAFQLLRLSQHAASSSSASHSPCLNTIFILKRRENVILSL